MNTSITIHISPHNLYKSRLFGESTLKHTSDTLVLMVDLSELPKDVFILQKGFLFIYMNEKKKRCSVFYEKDMADERFVKGGYPIEFQLSDTHSDTFKLLGKPFELNYLASIDEFLLMQFDPYLMDDMPLFSTLDGYVYVFMKKEDYINKDFHHVYMIIDRT